MNTKNVNFLNQQLENIITRQMVSITRCMKITDMKVRIWGKHNFISLPIYSRCSFFKNKEPLEKEVMEVERTESC